MVRESEIFNEAEEQVRCRSAPARVPAGFGDSAQRRDWSRGHEPGQMMRMRGYGARFASPLSHRACRKTSFVGVGSRGPERRAPGVAHAEPLAMMAGVF